MTWLSDKNRVLGVIHASRLARARGDGQIANNLLLKAVCFAPLTASFIILRMLLCGLDVMYHIPLDDSSKSSECWTQKS